MFRSWPIFRAHPNAPARVIGVAVGTDTCETATAFQQATGFTFPTGVDEQSEVRSSYQLKRVPSVILVDPAGFVLRKYIGNRDEFAPAIDTALDAIEKGISIPSYDLEGAG
ncbi:MAG TPA: redoxin domain-containing protein [Armatimonadota bacterium]|nr:redoxin domain-containing protein [Armatimonadota bacterium]